MRILASDFDSTFNYGGIDDQKREAVKRWQEKGNLFGIVSGRGMYNLLDIQEEIGIKCDFLIGNNGAQIYTGEGKVIHEDRCDASITKPLIEKIFSLGGTLCYINSSFHFVVVKEMPEDAADNVFTLENIPEHEYFTSLGFVIEPHHLAGEVSAIIAEEFKGRLDVHYHGGCVEIVPLGVNKAVGIHHLLKFLGASAEDVIAVGDHLNDLEMVEEFYSYTVEIGIDEIKAAANHIVPNVTELIEAEIDK